MRQVSTVSASYMVALLMRDYILRSKDDYIHFSLSLLDCSVSWMVCIWLEETPLPVIMVSALL